VKVQLFQRARIVLNALLSVSFWSLLFFTYGVTARFAIEYTVNSTRNTSHWVEYFDVVPTRENYPVGTHPKFRSHSIWHLTVRAAWPDVMRCNMLEGPDRGEIVSFRLQTSEEERLWELSFEPVKPRMTGFYDENGELLEDSSSGIWMWNGQIPQYKSMCWLEPNPVINPSPLVFRDVPAPHTQLFWFR